MTLEECLTALNSFKCNKSPGVDGLPYKFYQCFWDIFVFITVLGCRISNDDSVDWASLLDRFSGQLALWKHRQLSFRGWALICNMLGLSIFWYQATVFDMPKTVIHAINKILFPFVWRKKREWMARTPVTQPLSQGGLGIVDVSRKVASLRAVWWQRFFTPSPHPWSVFCHHYVDIVFHCPPSDVLVHDSIPAYRIKKLPSFYASLLRIWQDLRGRKEQGIWVIPYKHANRKIGKPLLNKTITRTVMLVHSNKKTESSFSFMQQHPNIRCNILKMLIISREPNMMAKYAKQSRVN